MDISQFSHNLPYNLLTALQTNTALTFTVTVVFALVVGSFLNVIIHRLPVMMQRDWDHQCRDYLKLPQEPKAPKYFNLFTPSSHCPNCNTPVKAWHNIPILGYLMLKGKCYSCHEKISMQYPFVELLTAVTSVLTIWHFGFNFAGLMALLFTWSLIVLTFIDIEHQILPDTITLPMLWLGLLVNLKHTFTLGSTAVLGVIFGYLCLWLVAQGFKILTKKEGMGYGDFKLLAMLGAWMGWKLLPIILIFSSICGVLLTVALIFFKLRSRTQPIPFGPYLAIAGWISLLWGAPLIAWYLGLLTQQYY